MDKFRSSDTCENGNYKLFTPKTKTKVNCFWLGRRGRSGAGRGRTQGVWDRLSASFRTYRIINMAKCKPQTNGQDKQDNSQADKQTKTDGQIDGQTDRQTYGQTGRQDNTVSALQALDICM